MPPSSGTRSRPDFPSKGDVASAIPAPRRRLNAPQRRHRTDDVVERTGWRGFFHQAAVLRRVVRHRPDTGV